jgi:transposase
MLEALAEGATDPLAVAALAEANLRATPEQLRDALAACAHLPPVYRRLLKMELKQLQFLEQQMQQLEQEIAQLLRPHAAAVERLAEVPGLGVESAQQIIAEIPRRRFSPRRRLCPPGWEFARARRSAPGRRAVAILPRAIALCAGYSIKPHTPPSR